MSATVPHLDKGHHLKWLLIGVGSTFGLLVLISLVFTAISYRAAARGTDLPQDTVIVVAFGLMLGAFLIGGFLIGWMSAQRRMLDTVLMAVITIFLSLAVYAALPESSRIQFLSGYLLSDLGRGAVFLVLAVIAAAAGVYWGWQVAIPEEAVLEETSISPERRRK